MKKVLIQIISVITLVFGTCYQSVIALANDTQRIELSGVQLSDDQGQVPRQVKVDDKYKLEMTVTINNKDGDETNGEAAVWLPEDQLNVLENRVATEATIPDTNARLIFDRRRDKSLRIRWENVKTQATFQLQLPVSLRHTMTSMALPVAVGTQKGVLQPLTVVAADTTDDQLQDAGEASGLPTDVLGSLDAFIQAQQAQEKAAAEAKAKAEAEAQEKAAQEKAAKKKAEQEKAAQEQAAKEKAAQEAAAKEEAEQREADKKEAQDAADKEKEAAKTESTLKSHKADASKESETDGTERENNDKKQAKAATDLGALLKQNAAPADQTLFDSVKIQANGQTHQLSPNDVTDISNLKDFELIYDWNSDSLMNKLDGLAIKSGDYYEFRIYGLDEFKGTSSGDIADVSNEKYATWELKNGADDQGKYQDIRITFTNEKMNQTRVDYQLKLKQTYSGSEPIDFEYDNAASWTVDPVETKQLLHKTGQFIGDNKIQWTVTLKNEGAMAFKDLELVDTLLLHGYANHAFVSDNWDVTYVNKTESLKNQFSYQLTGLDKVTLTGTSDEEVQDDLVFTFVTTYGEETTGTFANQAGGKIGDKTTLEDVRATVSTASLSKTAKGYSNGLYSWEATVKLNLDQYATDAEKLAALKSLTLTDTLSGPHIFDKEKLSLQMKVGNQDVTSYFNDQVLDTKTLKLTPKDSAIEALLAAFKENDTLTMTYKTVENGAGAIGAVKNSVQMAIDGTTQSQNAAGTGDGLGVKSGELVRDYRDDDKAHVKWTITANPYKHKFDDLTVIDVLPEGVTHQDVDKIVILVDGHVVDIANTKGFVTSASGTNNASLYDFQELSDDEEVPAGARSALKFEFGKQYSGQQIKITFETSHEWDADKYTNNAGFSINGLRWEYSHATVKVAERIRENVYKQGKLSL